MIANVIAETQNDVTIQLLERITNVDVAAVGIQGARGYSVLSGNGAPSNLDGINSDLYINMLNGFLYKKESNVWNYKLYLVPQVQKITITQAMINAKGVTLALSPLNPDAVTLSFVAGGGEQDNGSDFSVSGAFVGWNGLGLDGFVEVGDVIKIRY